MHPIEAAYDLGYSLPLIYRHMLYHWHYAPLMDRFNFYEATADHLKLTLRRVKFCLGELEDILDNGASKELGDSLNEVAGVAIELLSTFESNKKWNGVDYGHGPCPGVTQHGHLSMLAKDTLKKSPALQAWQRVGDAVGRCSLSTVTAAVRSEDETSPEDEKEIELDLRPLRQAVHALKPSTVASVPFLSRCAQLSVGDAEQDPVRSLNLLLDLPLRDVAEVTRSNDGISAA